MDKIILGILMIKRLPAYEIRNIIRQNYCAMCSDSLGSIQVALKKLLEATEQADMEMNIDGIRYFENMTLQFGIAETIFQIEWFSKLRDTVSKGGVSHA